MKRSMLLMLLGCLCFSAVQGQKQRLIDSMQNQLPKLQEDSNKVNLLLNLGNAYFSVNPGEGIRQDKQAADLSKKINWKRGIAQSNYSIGNILLKWKSDYTNAMVYFTKSLKIYDELRDKTMMSKLDRIIGNIYIYLSDYPNALDYEFKSLKINQQLDDKNGIASNYANIGNIYKAQGKSGKALDYYQKSLEINEAIHNKSQESVNYTNIVNIYIEESNYPKALEYTLKGVKLDEELGDKNALAGGYISIGLIYLHQNEHASSLEYLNKALGIISRTENRNLYANAQLIVADNYIGIIKDSDVVSLNSLFNGSKSNAISSAKMYIDSAMSIFRNTGDLKNMMRGYNSLRDLQILQSDYKGAMQSYKLMTSLHDSVFSMEKDKKLTQTALNYEFAKKEDSLRAISEKKQLILQREIELKSLRYEFEKKEAAAITEKEKQKLKFEERFKEQQIKNEFDRKTAKAAAEQKEKEADREKREAVARVEQEKKDTQERNIRNSILIGLCGALIFLVIVLRQRNRVKKEKANVEKEKANVEKEKERSEELLLNILPEEVAHELKEKGFAEAKLMNEVTVLFTDFKGFTEISQKLAPHELVAMINKCFSQFDHIMHKHGIEKIKTIGDAYMAAGGLPTANETHAVDMVKAALEIQEFMHQHKKEGETLGELYFEVRIGIHTGPVVAGIVGVRKFQYDIWGDTVNTASRMESGGETGKVNISGATYEIIKDHFNCIHRGKIQAKGKGEVDMYFVEPLDNQKESSLLKGDLLSPLN